MNWKEFSLEFLQLMMKKTQKFSPLRKIGALPILLVFSVPHAGAELLIYEGFDYATAGNDRAGAELLHEQPTGEDGDVDAIGLSGVWLDSLGPGVVSDFFLQLGSLEFGDLATSGNSVRSDTNLNNDIFSRGIVPDLAATGTGEIWMSFLANKLQNNFQAAESGLVIANGVLENSRLLENDGSDGLAGFGVGPTTSGNNWTAYGWNGTTQVVGDEALQVPTNGSETNLLIGRIELNAGAGGADRFTLFSYLLNEGQIAGGSLNEITRIEVDVDESELDTLNLTRQVNTHYDEIRVGESLSDVLASGPGPVPLQVISIAPVAGNIFEIAFTGSPASAYELRVSDDLDFENGTLIIGLTQSDGSDAGTIGGANGSEITPDDNGNATVRFPFGNGLRNFVRVVRRADQ